MAGPISVALTRPAAIAHRGITRALGDRLQALRQNIGELEAEHAALVATIEDAPLLTMKVAELEKELTKAAPDRQRVNALLRQMAKAVVVDYRQSQLVSNGSMAARVR